MADLDEAARNWIATPFPTSSRIDDVAEVHADLALYDTWVAESVLPYLQGRVWSPAVPDVLAALGELMGRVQSLREAGTVDEDHLAAYSLYAQLLVEVYREFLRCRPV